MYLQYLVVPIIIHYMLYLINIKNIRLPVKNDVIELLLKMNIKNYITFSFYISDKFLFATLFSLSSIYFAFYLKYLTFIL